MTANRDAIVSVIVSFLAVAVILGGARFAYCAERLRSPEYLTRSFRTSTGNRLAGNYLTRTCAGKTCLRTMLKARPPRTETGSSFCWTPHGTTPRRNCGAFCGTKPAT
jgi:hypothetical protein